MRFTTISRQFRFIFKLAKFTHREHLGGRRHWAADEHRQGGQAQSGDEEKGQQGMEVGSCQKLEQVEVGRSCQAL